MSTLLNKKIVTYNNISLFDNVKGLLKNESSKFFIIPNICWPYNKKISGFSRQLYEHYPIVEANINTSNIPKNLCSMLLAEKNTITKGKIFIANMYCQNSKKKNNRLIHYGQLVYCMYEIKNFIQNLKDNFPDFTTEIHCPKFGTGSCGGNWIFIQDLIDDIWALNNIYIYNHTNSKKNHND
jgi:hypothetical protein